MSVADRFREERERLGGTVSRVAERAGVDRKSVQRWETGTPVPSNALESLAPLGFDVQFVVTGRRSENAAAIRDSHARYAVEPSMTKDELKLLKRFRDLSAAGRGQALKMLEVLAMGLAPGGGATISVRDASGAVKIAGRDVVEGGAQRREARERQRRLRRERDALLALEGAAPTATVIERGSKRKR